MNAPQSICILRLSAIGDVCHTLAVVQAIQRHYPQAEISWILGKTEYNLLSDVPKVKFIVYDKREGWKGIVTLWSQLRHKRFDVLLNLQTALRASILSLGIKATRKIGFNRDRAREGQWLFTNEKVEKTTSPHVLDGQMMFAKAIGVADLTPKWQLPISPEDRDYSSQFIDKSRKNLVLAPCSSRQAKDWSPENYAEIARLLSAYDVNVIVSGSPSDYEMQTATKIAELAPNCRNVAGKTTLKQLAGLIQQADLVLSSDSGPAHITTTQGTSVIGLYAIHNPRRTGPYNDLDKVISVYDEAVLAQYGKPWNELPWATRAKGDNLMQQISVETVKQKILETLQLPL